MTRLAAILALLSSFYCISLTAQKNVIDSNIVIPMVKLSYAFQVPGGALSERFGVNSNVGAQVAVKTRNNLYFGLAGSYIFSGSVKEDDILDDIRTSEGGVIDNAGELNYPFFEQRGYSIFLTAGKVIPVWSANPNSGLLIYGGVGYLEHFVKIDFRDATIPQLDEEYRKGYDRLTGGFALNQFIGYVHFGKRRLTNFFGGFDLTQAWTVNKRGVNLDEMQPTPDERRFESLIGFRLGFILPLYKAAPKEYYFY